MNILLSEITNMLGAAFFVFLFIIRVMQFSDGNITAILLALQAALAAVSYTHLTLPTSDLV